MYITEVIEGDTIIEGSTRIEVKRIEHNACSTKATHVNDRYCYDRSSEVVVKPGKPKLLQGNFEE
jgi:hypothetical protein